MNRHNRPDAEPEADPAETSVGHHGQEVRRQKDDGNDDLAQRLDRLWSRPQQENAHGTSKTFSARMVGVKVGSYTISRVIGAGSFGVIFKAEAGSLSRSVALKIPRHEVLADRDKLRRFKVEAISSASLDHPGIVPVYDADLDSDPPYIASAYCPGPNLQQWIEEYGSPVNTDDSVRLLIQIAAAVQHAHTHGVIHRDLKPSNVMLVDPGDDDTVLSNYTARITDFGLARLAQADMLQTKSSLVLGTPLYMAPEQAECRFGEVGPATDVFALGAILFQLLSGHPPFAAENYSSLLIQLREDAPESVRRYRSDIAPDLDVICKTCLQRNPADRYASAEAFAQDLSLYLASEPIKARAPTVLQRLKQWSLRPSRISDFCVTFMMLSLFRIAFSVLGLIAVNLSEAVNPTFSENLDVLVMLLLGTTPLDIGLTYLAYRNQKRKLSRFTYLAVLTGVCVIGLLTTATAINILDAPSWYDRMPAAKLMVFLLIGMLFGLQFVCWYLGDWFRIEKRGKNYAGRRAKRVILYVSLLLFSAAALGKHGFTNQAPFNGPRNSILLDGQDDCVVVESAGYFDGDQFTLESWVEFQGNHDGTVISYPPVVLKLMPAGDQAVVRVVVIHKDESMLLIDSMATIPLNQWAHLAVTYSGNQLNLFVNGEPVDTVVRTLDLDDEMAEVTMPDRLDLDAIYGVSPVHIGIRNLTSPQTAFYGRIGEVRVSSSVRYVDRFIPSRELADDSQAKFILKLDESESGFVGAPPQRFRTTLHR